MAGKVSFNPKAFLIEHGEKVALGLIIPVALVLMYLGFVYSPPTWTAKDLEAIASRSDTHITNSIRDAGDEEVTVFAYDNFAQMIKVGVRPDRYQTRVLWRPSLFPEKQKRGPVTILPVHNLNAVSGIGAVLVQPSTPDDGMMGSSSVGAGVGGATGGEKEGKRWSLVTGLIPIQEQFNQYLAAFSNATFTDPMRDTPLYYTYNIQRCEVTPTGNGQWVDLDPFAALMKTEVPRWQGFSPEVIDPTFIAPRSILPLAFPLPPLMGRSFGKEAAYIPQIPMLAESLQDEHKTQQALMKQLRKEEDQRISRETLLNTNLFTGAQNTDLPLEEEEEIVHVDHYLFRYFDFEVESGKTYRYRVQLIAANPNAGLNEVAVDDASLTRENYLQSEWSDPSKAVMIGRDARLLFSGVTAPSRPERDPTTSLVAVHFDLENGTEAYTKELSATRGTFGNFTNQTVTNPEKIAAANAGSGSPGTGGRTTARAGTGAGTRAGRNADANKPIDIVSDVCVLDIFGGAVMVPTNMSVATEDRESGKLKSVKQLRSPGKVVIVSPSGAMEIRTVSEDTQAIDELRNTASSARGASGMSGGGRGDMGSDMGM